MKPYLPKKPRVVVVILTILSVFLFSLTFGDNFRTVIPDNVYRSKQLSGKRLREYLEQYQIRSVINLRGKYPKAKWYTDEIQTTSEAGAAQYDIKLPANRLPCSVDIKELIHTILNAEKPILMHCHAGVDRASLASAIAMIVLENSPYQDIIDRAYLKTSYYTDNSVLTLFLQQYNRWLRNHGAKHDKEVFIKWAAQEYHDSYGDFIYYIDAVNKQLVTVGMGKNRGKTLHLNRKKQPELSVSGWMHDRVNGSVIRSLSISLGDAFIGKAKTGLVRNDLAPTFKETYQGAGWKMNKSVRGLSPGCYPLKMHVTRIDGTAWTSPEQLKVCLSDG